MMVNIFKSRDPVSTTPAIKEAKQKIDKLTRGSHRTIFKATAVFPFDFFPDTIIIDENKVDIIVTTFFVTEQMYSIPIQNIIGADAMISLFFGTLTLETTGYKKSPPPITHLWNTDAVKARRYINALVMCNKDKIDLSKLEIPYLCQKLDEIGKARM